MKKLIYITIALLAFAACAKDPKVGTNDNAKEQFEAWVLVNHPDAQKTEWGAYILSETPGVGVLASDSKYVTVDYTVRNLNGVVTYTNDENLAKQVGTFKEENNYLPIVWKRSGNALSAGVEEAVKSMKVGGNKKVAIPGWLFTTKRFTTAKEYADSVTFTANAIYDITLREVIDDIVKWELDSIAKYIDRNYNKSASDSLLYGFYYVQEKAPTDTNTFKQDSTIYINYTGKLLNGRVFDTNIADTAKFYGIYNASKTYGPSSVTWDQETFTNIKLGSSSTINGFAYLLSKMRHFEKGTGIFYSKLGYGTEGSGESIPTYSPLIFEVEIVSKPQ